MQTRQGWKGWQTFFFVLNQWIKVTLKNVFEIIKEYNLKDSVNVLTWGPYDSDFQPNTLDVRFKIWAKKGITAYCTIIDKGQLLDLSSAPTTFLSEN